MSIGWLAHGSPPTPDRFHGKLRGIVIHAHAYPATVAAHITDAVGSRPPQFCSHKVVDANEFGVAFGPPFLAVILEISHQLPLFGVHRDHWLAPPQTPFHLPVQVLELSIAVRMIRPFFGLAVALQ